MRSSLPGEDRCPSIEGLHRLRREDLDAVQEVLVGGFMDDPLIRGIAGDGRDGQGLCRAFFSYELRYEMRRAIGFASSDRFEGVALWHAPGTPDSVRFATLRPSTYRLLGSVGPEVFKRLLELGQATDALRRRIVEGPHWYLKYLAVVPEERGKGFARRLLAPMLEACDVQESPCFLFTQNERNVGLYQHFGFEVAAELPFEAFGIIMYGMLRPSPK